VQYQQSSEQVRLSHTHSLNKVLEQVQLLPKKSARKHVLTHTVNEHRLTHSWQESYIYTSRTCIHTHTRLPYHRHTQQSLEQWSSTRFSRGPIFFLSGWSGGQKHNYKSFVDCKLTSRSPNIYNIRLKHTKTNLAYNWLRSNIPPYYAGEYVGTDL
jgi:hypothetical protein